MHLRAPEVSWSRTPARIPHASSTANIRLYNLDSAYLTCGHDRVRHDVNGHPSLRRRAALVARMPRLFAGAPLTTFAGPLPKLRPKDGTKTNTKGTLQVRVLRRTS